MRKISLSQRQVALIDDVDFYYLNQFKWYAIKKGNSWYVVKNNPREYMHHVLLGHQEKGLDIDHEDGNGLNNQRFNLKIKTHRANLQNMHLHRKGKLVGAKFLKDRIRTKPWLAIIRINGKQKSIGNFKTELEAHEAYMRAC